MSKRKNWVKPLIIIISVLVFSASNLHAGTITGISVSADDLTTTATAQYTFTFTPPTTVNSGMWCDGAYFWFDFDDEYTVSGASLGSISPSISGMSINNKNDGNGQIRMYTSSGSITGGEQYIVVFNGIQNPPTVKTPVNHVIRTGEGCGTVDQGAVAADPITAAASNPPIVSSAIPNKSSLLESEGVIQYIADLNNHFTDGDGDTMNFSASSSDSSIVAVTLSGTNNRTLHLQALKYGSADITVTATATDGTVDDIFNVTTIGALPIASVSEGSLETSTTTSYTFVFTPETTINSGMWCDAAYIWFDFDDDYTVSGASLGSISPSITGMAIAAKTDANGQIRMSTASGSIVGGQQYTVILNNIQNPPTAQTPVAHIIRTGEGCGTIDTGTIAANSIVTAATNPPVVDSAIPDKSSLLESDGVVQYVADLNNHFLDGDGDTMNFSASSSDSSTVAVSLSGTNNRILSIQALKYGSSDITVTATATDGSVDDIFNVTSIGELTINSLSSSSNESSQLASFTINFTLETAVSDSGGDGAYLYFNLPSQYSADGSSISITSPSISGTTQSSGSNVWFIAINPTIAAGTYTATISNVTNPDTGGSFGDLILDTRNGGGTTYDIGNFTLPAITTSNYTVTYDGNSNTGGNPPTDGNTYLIGDTVTVLGNTGSLTRTGYTFVGWNASAPDSGPTYIAGDTFAMGSSNVTLYAKWTANPTYTVTYDGNGSTSGTPPVDASLYETDDVITVQGNTGSLERTGYSFLGWNTADNGSGTSYVGGDTFLMASANVILYAEWTAEPTYTVTYDGNNNTSGTAPVDSQNYLEGASVTVLNNTGSLARTGYSFLGWNSKTDGTGTPYAEGSTFPLGNSNVTLYAHWQNNNPTYSVSYDGNANDGGTAPVDSVTYQQGETVTVKSNTGNLYRSDYKFAGWNTAANGSGISYNEADTFSMGTANLTLFAQWIEYNPWILFTPALIKKNN